ncbi:malonyl-coenzyme:anthocyanin 5-O-glucoside-6'''-O-malonyltransferase-like [Salvia divinorum]|uniref:Malonyl-coenzyme:anthocyanin 5-O-glucoside-6'''-O-malonyltransferase-like n=1 Tax=Salvia divinorum TaxID=28513 RepID=A0ABD1GVE0_SALDI
MTIRIVELHSISPSSDGSAEQSLPLLHFDMTIVPMLKNSLSIALKHFLTLASNIIFPVTSAAMPVSRYTIGYSVTLTSDVDFAKLMANQVTLFPNMGICIDLTNHHALCDATTLFAFLGIWASIHKSNAGGEYSVHDSLPFYGRDSVEDSHELSAFVWDQSCLATAWEVVHDDEPEFLTSSVECRRRLNPPLQENYFGNCLMFMRIMDGEERLRMNAFIQIMMELLIFVKEVMEEW